MIKTTHVITITHTCILSLYPAPRFQQKAFGHARGLLEGRVCAAARSVEAVSLETNMYIYIYIYVYIYICIHTI